MIEEIKVGQKNILFARHNGKLIYPKYASTENLVLHYDFSGRTNLDVQKGIAEDLSGNGNNGVLQNFAYTDESGYLDNFLIFDGIDDFITIPKPQINLDNFTYSEGINVLSFRGEEVVQVVNGSVEIGGRNLLLNTSEVPVDRVTKENSVTNMILVTEKITWKAEQKYTLSFDFKSESGFPIANYNHLWPSSPDTGGTYSIGKIALIDDSEWHRITHTFSFPIDRYGHIQIRGYSGNDGILGGVSYSVRKFKLEIGNKATDWSPAPKDLETTTFKPLFDKKINSALYWNRALTDEELLQVYNIQIKRT